MKAIDLTGQRFGKLIAIKKVKFNVKREAMWLCKCDCGNETVVSGVLCDEEILNLVVAKSCLI